MSPSVPPTNAIKQHVMDPIIKNILYTLTYSFYGRKYETPINPSKLLFIDPAFIEKIPIEKPSLELRLISGVKDGNWDRVTRPVKQDVVYRSFIQRFQKGQDWETTNYHDLMLSRLNNSSFSWRRFKSVEHLHERYEALDQLFSSMSRHGYTTQKHIAKSETRVPFPKKITGELLLPPEFNEISVFIGRNGDFLWAQGIHRLCMAQIIGIDEVPVRVRVRHEQWQLYRDKVMVGEAEATSHPDIVSLYSSSK